MKPLTKQQQELVETNHKLIYKFAIKNNLPIDEYYDILAIGLCKAAQIFDKNNGAFSTIAYRCMANDVKNYWRHLSIKSAVPSGMVMYYDSPNKNMHYEPVEPVSVLDCIASDSCTHDAAINNVVVSDLFGLLKEDEKLIAKLIMLGMNQTEIAKIAKCTKQNINSKVNKIRKKYFVHLH